MEGRFLSFEKFRLDLRTGDLFREDRTVRLPPQPTKLLLLLTRSPGTLVSHEEIQKELWGEDTFVDFEQAIKKCVKQVRSALGDEAEAPLYVETVPRRGYRFIGRPGVEGEPAPYPGLSSFLEKDAHFFFGREKEAEALWNKIERRKLLALIGPSGSGKSSFLRAGLLPSRREGWQVEIATPGNSALSSMPSRASANGSFLFVVDAFEELFTRNPPDVQKEFSERLERLAREKDTHVLLSMRDDFLFRCHEQESLQDVFFDLTPLGPLSGPALREALSKPAAVCGYRFEEGLVDEMVQEVEKLPLLAFAAAQLWEKRDREARVLTRAAYVELGRVGGALAQHAERTLQSIGVERQSTVREIFRNLTTSQGTRVAIGKNELLSAFPEREMASGVLSKLIDARLLTSSESGIEIVHESLLTSWPRLTQWQAQDAEGTVLRDQLRQAARTWQERGRTADLLWAGTAFRDFTIWRERYPGRLTETEEGFARAMAERAHRQKKRRRAALALAFGLMLGVALVTSTLWRRAVVEAERREAAQILALGRLELEDRPTAALAHALASLERADSSEARRFAVDALWRGGSAFVLHENCNGSDFSPDGKWLATSGLRSGVLLWSREGGEQKRLGGVDGSLSVQFGPGSDFLAAGGEETAQFWSLPQASEALRIGIEAPTEFSRLGTRFVGIANVSKNTRVLREWFSHRAAPGILATIDLDQVGAWTIDPSLRRLLTGRGADIYVTPLADRTTGKPRLIGSHRSNVVSLSSHPAVERVISADEAGEIRTWSSSDDSAHSERTFHAPPGFKAILDPTDRWVLAVRTGPHSTSEVARLWNLRDPPDAEPLVLRNRDAIFLNEATFEPEGKWLFTTHDFLGILWPLPLKRSRVFLGQSAPYIQVAFTPDSNGFVSASDDGTLRLWPLSGEEGERARILFADEQARLGFGIDVDPSGTYALVGSRFAPQVFAVPLKGGEPLQMTGFKGGQGFVNRVAFSPDGSFAVAAGNAPPLLRIWDLASGEMRLLDLRSKDTRCVFREDGQTFIWDMKFLPNGRLLAVGDSGILTWDLVAGTSREIRRCSGKDVESLLAVDPNGQRFLVVDVDPATRTSTFGSYEVETGIFQEIESHGNRVYAVAVDATGTIAVTGDLDGVLRAGPITGEEPHLFFGHEGEISSVDVSPDGRWIVSGSQDGTIRLWPMPEGTPLQTLPRGELLERLRSLTNLRIVPDVTSDTGYRVVAGPLPDWKRPPVW